MGYYPSRIRVIARLSSEGFSGNNPKVTSVGDQFAEMVRARLKELGVNAYALEKQLGLPRDAIRNVIRQDKKRTEPTIGRAKVISDALGLRFDMSSASLNERDLVAVSDSEFVRVPLHDVELAAGAGFINRGEAVGTDLRFRREWMQKVGLATRDARLVRVRGDSMQPMLFDTDIVLLDTSRVDVPIGRKRASGAHTRYLIALEHHGEARVKWAERPTDDTLVISSENSGSYSPEVYVRAELDGLRIIGHVIWWCHTVRD